MFLGGGQSLKPPYRVAFTLTELLMALTIVGVLAVLTVPILMNNFQNRLFATQIKNFSAEIEQFAQDQLITHKTRDLFDTDFGTPSKLLTDGHFSIVKICPENNSLKDCWKTTATGKDKVTYKRLDGSKYTKVWSNCSPTIVLKNGVMFCYGTMDNNLRIICLMENFFTVLNLNVLDYEENVTNQKLLTHKIKIFTFHNKV